MMSIETIHAMARRAARLSRERHQEPYHPQSLSEIDKFPPFPFPFLGPRCPRGWKRADKVWFVDSSGFGREGEPALTIAQFKRELREWFEHHPACGFAVIEAGQFQVYVAAFERRADARRAAA